MWIGVGAHLAEVEASLLSVGNTGNLEERGVGLLVALAAGEALNAALDVKSNEDKQGHGQLGCSQGAAAERLHVGQPETSEASSPSRIVELISFLL